MNATVFTNYMQVRWRNRIRVRLWHIVFIAVSAPVNEPIRLLVFVFPQMTWTKPLLMRAVLNLNYTVLFSDLDTVWLKPAVWSMTSVLDTYNADITAMPGNKSYICGMHAYQLISVGGSLLIGFAS